MPTRRRAPKRPADAKRQQALVLIAGGHSTTEVAAAMKVNRATVNRWRSDPEFDEQLRNLQDAQADAVHALMSAEQLRVARAIVQMATDMDSKPDMARIKACQVFFELLGKHKGSPVAAPTKGADPETEDDLLAVLDGVPLAMLEQAVAAKKAPRERSL